MFQLFRIMISVIILVFYKLNEINWKPGLAPRLFCLQDDMIFQDLQDERSKKIPEDYFCEVNRNGWASPVDISFTQSLILREKIADRIK